MQKEEVLRIARLYMRDRQSKTATPASRRDTAVRQGAKKACDERDT